MKIVYKLVSTFSETNCTSLFKRLIDSSLDGIREKKTQTSRLTFTHSLLKGSINNKIILFGTNYILPCCP